MKLEWHKQSKIFWSATIPMEHRGQSYFHVMDKNVTDAWVLTYNGTRIDRPFNSATDAMSFAQKLIDTDDIGLAAMWRASLKTGLPIQTGHQTSGG